MESRAEKSTTPTRKRNNHRTKHAHHSLPGLRTTPQRLPPLAPLPLHPHPRPLALRRIRHNQRRPKSGEQRLRGHIPPNPPANRLRTVHAAFLNAADDGIRLSVG